MEFPFSAACERNKDPILGVIKPFLADAKTVLEIGAGTGQHAVYFADQLPHLIWQPSDQLQYLGGIRAQIENAKAQIVNKSELQNLSAPIELDVIKTPWIRSQDQDNQFDVVYTANTLHIMPWESVSALFKNIAEVLAEKSRLIVYGPFKYNGQFTSPSNRDFDDDLQSRGCGSAIRDFEEVDRLARAAGLDFIVDNKMPANNQCIVWQKVG